MADNRLGRRLLLCKMEGTMGEWVMNNTTFIRYPLSWSDGTELRGKNKILKAGSYEIEEILQGKYIFGANALYVFQALNQLLNYLESEGGHDLEELYDRLEREYTAAGDGDDL